MQSAYPIDACATLYMCTPCQICDLRAAQTHGIRKAATDSEYESNNGWRHEFPNVTPLIYTWATCAHAHNIIIGQWTCLPMRCLSLSIRRTTSYGRFPDGCSVDNYLSWVLWPTPCELRSSISENGSFHSLTTNHNSTVLDLGKISARRTSPISIWSQRYESFCHWMSGLLR